jgi:hypothetical protein
MTTPLDDRHPIVREAIATLGPVSGVSEYFTDACERAGVLDAPKQRALADIVAIMADAGRASERSRPDGRAFEATATRAILLGIRLAKKGLV